MSLSALGALVRLAKRDARRSPGRSALVTALVAVPVAGLVVGLALVGSTTPTADQLARWELGQADLVVEAVPTGVDLAPLLPPGARAVAEDADLAQVELDGERLAASLRALPLGDSLIEGMLRLDRGRAPVGADEVAASASVLEAAGIDIGGTLPLSQPDVDLPVTGTVIEPQNIRGATLVMAPGGLDALADGDVAERRRWLVALDGSDPAVVGARLRSDHALVATTRDELARRSGGPGPVSFVFVLGALALFEAGLSWLGRPSPWVHGARPVPSA